MAPGPLQPPSNSSTPETAALDCDECGNRSVTPIETNGYRIHECSLCGALFGDRDAVEWIEDRREAEALGIEPDMYPLVKILNQLPGLTTIRSSIGDPNQGFKPHVMIRCTEDSFESLRKLMTSLTMINRETKVRWILEVEMQRDLCFVIKPRRPHAIDESLKTYIRDCQTDVTLLSKRLKRDLNLSFWRE